MGESDPTAGKKKKEFDNKGDGRGRRLSNGIYMYCKVDRVGYSRITATVDLQIRASEFLF